MKHLTMEELQAGVDEIRRAPRSEGVLQLIVRRPKVEEREILEEAQLDAAEGLVGDTWRMRKSTRTADGSPHPDMQAEHHDARVASLLAEEKSGGRWPATSRSRPGSSRANLPRARSSRRFRGHQVTDQPHTGAVSSCLPVRRGRDEASTTRRLGRELCLRGINAKVASVRGPSVPET